MAAAGIPSLERSGLEVARKSINALCAELARVADAIPEGLAPAASLIARSVYPIVVSGIGKSGIAAQTVASTFRSTGTPAVAVNAGDAAHGDLGLLIPGSCVVLISVSGETDEVLRIIPAARARNCAIISITARESSRLGEKSDVVVACGPCEATGDWLVPTVSTSVATAIGIALAQMVRKARRISLAEIAELHPGGAIGAQLRRSVADLMHRHDLPICAPNDRLSLIAQIISKGELGACVVLKEGALVGVITDGDVRRAVEHGKLKAMALEIMSAAPLSIGVHETFGAGLRRMHEANISLLVVLDEDSQVAGLLTIHD